MLLYFSIGLENHTHGTEYPVHFYNLGLSGRNYINKKNWTLKTFSTLYYGLEPIPNRVSSIVF